MGRPRAKFSLLLSGLMVFQLVFPMVNALAADSSTQPVATSEVSTSPVQPSEPAPTADTSTDSQDAEPAPAKSTPAPAPTQPVQTLATTSSTTVPAPTKLVYTAQSPSDIKLEWEAVSGVTSYKIYTVADDGTKTLVTTSTTTNKVINNLPQGRSTFGVAAVSGTEESALSNLLPLNIQYPNLAAPTALTHTFKNGNDFELKWSAVEYAGSYEVYQILGNGEQKLLSSPTTTSYAVTNLAQGNYTYIVKAINTLYGQSPVSEPLNVTVTYPVMAAPGNATHSIISGNDIKLQWAAAEYATAYNVYQIIDGQKVLKATTNSVNRTFTNMPAGNYTYQIYSYSDRFGESQTGSAVSFTLEHPTMTAPANLSKTILNVNDAKLTWGAVTHATAYKVYQLVNGEKVLKNTVTTTNTTFTALPAESYTYVVHSVSDRFGESAEGSTITFTIGEVDLLAPANVSHTILNGNDIQLKWNAATNAQSYRIYQIIDGQKELKSTQTTLNKTFTNMPAGDYTYEIYSYNDRLGESNTGSTVSFTLTLPTLEAPSNLTQSILNGNDIKLAWNTVAFATSYKVYQVVNGQKELKATVTSTNKTFTNMPAGDYEFEVTAVSDRFGEAPAGAPLTFALAYPELLAPTNLSKTILNGNDIKLAWTAAQYATSYKIYQIVDGQKVLKDTVTTLNKTYTNNPAGPYTFEIHTYSDRFGESATGASITFTLGQTDLVAPTNLTNSTLNGNDIKLSWTAATNATAYQIYQIIDGQKELKATVATLNKTFTNMPAGDYTYEVYSFSDRFGESETGAQTSLTLVHPVMETPGNFTQSVANGNDIQLKWNAVPFATSYKVYQIIDGQKELKATITSVSKTFTNMPAGDYSYEVYSFSDRFGESATGNAVSLTLIHPVMASPTPGNPAQSVANGNDIQLKWTSVSYANSYKLYQVIDGKKVLKDTVTSISKTYTNMPAGDYNFVIHSYSDRFGESAEGVNISLTLVHPIMETPATFASSIKNGNDIYLSWNASAYVTEYRVYQYVNGQKSLAWKGTTLNRTFTNMPEGDYRYEITSYSSRFGESAPSQIIEQNVTHPTMEAPALTTQITSMSPVTVKLNWTAIPFATKYYVYRIINNEPVLMRSVTTTNTTFNYLAPDRYEFVVTSFSDRFGESVISIPAPVDLFFDTTAPQTTANAPTGWNKQSATVTLTATDNSSGVAKTLYSIDGAPFVEGTSITVNTEGEHTISYYSVDRAGNTETPKTVTVKVDTTAPDTTTAMLPVDLWSAEDINLTLTATDGSSGIAKTYYSINGTPFVEGNVVALTTDGIYTVEFYSVDKAGNTEAKKAVEVKIDKTAPVTTSDAEEGWLKGSTTIALDATDNLSGVLKTFSSINDGEFVEGNSVLVNTAGINKVSFYSVDAAGNREATQTVQVNIDGNAPVTTSDATDVWNKEAVTVNLTATDAETEVAKTFYSINGGAYVEGTSVLVEQAGTNTISFYSVDVAGNQEAAKTAVVKIDGNAPVTTSDATDVWNKEAVTVNLTATDAETSVAKTFYSINGGAYVEGTSLVVDKEGINTISFYSVDAAGNQETAKTAVVKIDTTAPVSTSNAPTTWSKTDVEIKLETTDDLSGTKQTFYSINGGEFVEGTSFIVDQEGINTISFYSIDVAGNQEEVQTAEVKLDKTAPTVAFEGSEEIPYGLQKFNYTAKDDLSGVVSETTTVDGPNLKITVKGRVLINLPLPGIYNVTVTATDAAGNTTTVTKTYTVYIPVAIEVTPNVIKGNKGVFTVRVNLPFLYNTNLFDLNSVTLNGVNALSSNNGYYQQAKNGQFKFERSDFDWNTPTVDLVFRGKVAGFPVLGKTTVKVIK